MKTSLVIALTYKTPNEEPASMIPITHKLRPSNTKSLRSAVPVLLALVGNRGAHTITNILLPARLAAFLQCRTHILRALRRQEPSSRAKIIGLVLTEQVKKISGAVRYFGDLILESREGRSIFLVEGRRLHVACCGGC